MKYFTRFVGGYATVIEAAPKKPHQNKDGTAGKSTIDPEADWTKKGAIFVWL